MCINAGETIDLLIIQRSRPSAARIFISQSSLWTPRKQNLTEFFLSESLMFSVKSSKLYSERIQNEKEMSISVSK